MALGWIAPTTLFGSVRLSEKAKISLVVLPFFTFRTEVQRVHMPAKNARGLVSSNANYTGGRFPSGKTSFSEKLVTGTTQLSSTPSQRRQCGVDTLRILVTPESLFRPFNANMGEGIPHRAIVSFLPSVPFRTMGEE
jgi:hypothetical protein